MSLKNQTVRVTSRENYWGGKIEKHFYSIENYEKPLDLSNESENENWNGENSLNWWDLSTIAEWKVEMDKMSNEN